MRKKEKLNALKKMLKFEFLIPILILTLVPVTFSEHEALEALLHRLDSKRASSSVQEAAARDVLRRLLPSHLSSFEFKIVSKVFAYLLFLVNSIFAL